MGCWQQDREAAPQGDAIQRKSRLTMPDLLQRRARALCPAGPAPSPAGGLFLTLQPERSAQFLMAKFIFGRLRAAADYSVARAPNLGNAHNETETGPVSDREAKQ